MVRGVYMEKQAAVQLAAGLTGFSESLVAREGSAARMAKVCPRHIMLFK